jgi:hypothetical protein
LSALGTGFASALALVAAVVLREELAAVRARAGAALVPAAVLFTVGRVT